MTGDVGVAGCLNVPLRLATRFHAVEEVADVEGGRIAADFLNRATGQQRRRREHHLATVARLHPAIAAFKPHRAGAQRDPVFLTKHKFHAILVAADDLLIGRRVVDAWRIDIANRPLAEVDAVGAPLKHAATDKAAPLLEVEAVEQSGVEGSPGRRPEIHVPVDHVWVGRRFRRQPAAGHRLHARRMGIHPLQCAEPAGAGELTSKGEVRQVPPLCARLKNHACPLHRVAEHKALADVLRAGLLAVHIFTGPGGLAGHRAVPVGPGRDQDGVDVLPVEQLAVVAVGVAAALAILLLSCFLDGSPAVFLDVADGRKLHVGLLHKAAEVVGAAPPDADPAHDDPLTRWHGPIEPEHRRRNDHWRCRSRAGSHGLLEKRPSTWCRPSHCGVCHEPPSPPRVDLP